MLNKSTIFISLGAACQPAHHLRLNGLRQGAYPFDWICTPAKSLNLILKNRFEGFFDEKNILERGISNPGEKGYLNKKYDTIFFHEFKDSEDYKNNFHKVKEKYSRRIKKFYEAINSGNPIFFIRHVMTKCETVELNNLIKELFPNLKYNLLIIDDTEEIKDNWGIENVFNQYMKTAPFDNAVSPIYNDAWTNLFLNYVGEVGRLDILPLESEE